MPPPPSASKDRTKTHTQKRGAYAALALGLAFIAMVAYFVVFGGRPQAQQTPEALTLPAGTEPQNLVKGGSDPEGDLLASRNAKLDLIDKNDPSRQSGTLSYASLEPLEARRYAFDKPEAWLFMVDGRSVYVRADSAKLYMPGRQKQPESGTMTGHVEIQMFAAKPDKSPVDRAVDQPTMTLRTETLAFEAAVGEVVLPGLVTVLFDGGKFVGTDIALVFNQPRESLSRADVRKGGYLTMNTDPRPSKPQPKPAEKPSEPGPAPTQVAQTPTAPAAPPRTPVETLYRLVMNEKVTVTQLQRRLDADKLELVARLLDNQLPANAITELKFASTGEEKPAAASPTATTPPAATNGTVVATAPDAATPSTLPAPSKDMVLAWTGPCVILPMEKAPDELKNNHVALRFTAEKTGLVNLADTDRGITGKATAIAYAATEAALSLIGTPESQVTMNVPGSGLLNAARIDADLMKGIIRTPGAGSLHAGADQASRQDLTWADKGEFAFWMRDGQLTNSLKAATVWGDVTGSGKDMTFKSKRAHAEFADAKELVITRTILTGDAVADSADTGHMQGGLIDVTFDPPVKGTEPRPRFVHAEDKVMVNRAGQRLAGNFLEARLIDVADGKVDVGSLLARGNVEFASEKDYLVGRTEELTADLGLDEAGKQKQLVTLVGSNSSITRNQPDREQGTITGTQMQIDGRRGRLEAFGAGDFDYKGFAKGAPSSIDAKWTKRMIYDDLDGLIDCLGDASIRYSPDVLTRNKADGEHVKLLITPGSPGQSLLASLPGESEPSKKSPDREVIKAEAYGSILDREGGTNARVESRSYAADGNEADKQTLQKLFYIEGPTILANNTAGTMDVPGAGKFLLMDQSQAPAAPSSAPGTRDLGGDARGVSLFEWAGSLHVERQPSGDTTLGMNDNVSVIHRALKDGTVTEIKCAAMTADLKEHGGSLGDSSRGKTELQHVEAVGGVYSASGPPKTEQNPKPAVRELLAQKLNYDALKQTIIAEADKNGVVTMFDPAAASPTTATWLSWDLATGNIEVKKPSGVAPR